MTENEFKNTNFKYGMEFKYQGKWHSLEKVDFEWGRVSSYLDDVDAEEIEDVRIKNENK